MVVKYIQCDNMTLKGGLVHMYTLTRNLFFFLLVDYRYLHTIENVRLGLKKGG